MEEMSVSATSNSLRSEELSAAVEGMVSLGTQTSSQLAKAVCGDEFHDGDWSMNDFSKSEGTLGTLTTTSRENRQKRELHGRTVVPDESSITSAGLKTLDTSKSSADKRSRMSLDTLTRLGLTEPSKSVTGLVAQRHEWRRDNSLMTPTGMIIGPSLHTPVSSLPSLGTPASGDFDRKYDCYSLVFEVYLKSIEVARLTDANFSAHLFRRSDKIGDLKATVLADVLKMNTIWQNLKLDGNNIHWTGAGALARALESNVTLERLDLTGNPIGKKGGTALANAMESNATLQALVLVGTMISDEGATAFARTLESNTTLHDLHLARNEIGVQGAMALATALESNITLQSLSLGSNEIDGEGIKALAKALESNTALKELNLRCNMIGGKGAVTLARALESNTTLQELNLGSDMIGAEGAKAFACALESNATLERLDLTGNPIGKKGGTALANALESNVTLQALYIGGNKISTAGAKAFAKALELNTSLQELNLGRNTIDDEGAKVLAKALEANVTLNALYLDSNNIHAEGTAVLAKALEINTTLQKLDLGRNKIGVEGVKALAETIKSKSSLKVLDLGYNKIGDEGAIAFAEALEPNTSLQMLYLGSNDIGDLAAKAMATALATNATLATLALSDNAVGDEGSMALAVALESNTTLQSLSLNNNDMGYDGAVALVDSLQKHNETLSNLFLFDQNIRSYLPEQIKELFMGKKRGAREFIRPLSPLPPRKPSWNDKGGAAHPYNDDSKMKLLVLGEYGPYSFHRYSGPTWPTPPRGAMYSYDNNMMPMGPRGPPYQGYPVPQGVPPQMGMPHPHHPQYAMPPCPGAYGPVGPPHGPPGHHLYMYPPFGPPPYGFQGRQEMLGHSPRPRAGPAGGSLFVQIGNKRRKLQHKRVNNHNCHRPDDSKINPLVLSENVPKVTPERPSNDKPQLDGPPRFSADRIEIKKEDITAVDALCGKGTSRSKHPGNVAYLALVAENMDAHRECGSKRCEKTKIRNKIIDEVMGRGGRFIRREDDRYFLLTKKEVERKVTESLKPRSRDHTS